MSDVVVSIRGLEVYGRHGVHDAERVLGQRFVVDLDMELADDRSSTTDDLADTVDYAAMADDIAHLVAGEPVALLERLCRLIADRALAEPLVRSATVTVAKPQVAIRHVLDDVAVTLHARRDAP
ncbi:MAG: dihydroneopterin aldolase [Thermoleophilia bacterium]|nr:dihydroneopterin aldolase [Thermoleophilia bacterium]